VLTGWLTVSVDGHLLTKTTVTNWNSLGLEALEWSPKATSRANCLATEGSHFFDNTTGVAKMYYNMKAGETVNNLHFEAGNIYLNAGIPADALYVTHNNWTINYLNQYMSDGTGIALNGITGFVANYSSSNFNAAVGWYTQGATSATLNDCWGKYTYSEDIFELFGSGTVVCNRCWAHHSNDDGFQVAETATVTLNYCLSYNNGLEMNRASNSGFCVEGVGATMYLYNSTAAYNYGPGISIGTNKASTVINNISYGNGTMLNNDDGSQDLSGASPNIDTCTHSYNIGGTKRSGWTLGIGEKLADPQFISTTDYKLKGNSPARGVGINVSLTSDFRGRTVPQNGKYDIGAYQSQQSLSRIGGRTVSIYSP
jgi:hypothetical protein